jgi:small subunit ribosomal protein S6
MTPAFLAPGISPGPKSKGKHMAIPSTTVAKKWAREYETIYILRPDVSTEDAAKIAARVPEVVERLGGKVTKVDNWGKRRLAYTIGRHIRGIMVYVKYVGYNDLVAEIERNLRLFDTVIRYQTVRLEGAIDLAEVVVVPEEVQFLPVEQTEDEPEPDAAQRLGLVPVERDNRHRRDPNENPDDLEDMDPELGGGLNESDD